MYDADINNRDVADVIHKYIDYSFLENRPARRKNSLALRLEAGLSVQQTKSYAGEPHDPEFNPLAVSGS